MAKGSTTRNAAKGSAKGSGGGGARPAGARPSGDDRSARLEQVRRSQRAGERRRTALIIGGAAALVAVLVAVVAVVIVREQRAEDPALVGLPASAAACDPVQTQPATGVSEHVGPGTSSPDVTTVDYGTVPAVFGQHYASPAYPASPFYTAEDRPPVEQLVHNLEHGYTIAWYTEDLPEDQRAQLQEIAQEARALGETNGKFIAAPWDASRGELPEGKTIGLAHWGAEEGSLQLCGAVSGEAITDFVTAHPYSDSPEPNAA
ncbi:DUF3105 domain-containing protein [Quadrisphaera sp. DSM 44207]|uniref:DUF3105 domain-containing protein n=1 Tax=Quadrisphaera sp. DSM 44207 TaxID=1881057 RepID=UPI00159FFE71|nr:DUF3105 domain-containing protein [Quadrisphaera sp. DSM 44207]